MICPKCGNKLTKNPKHGERVFECKECETTWFIMKLRGK